jgi:CRISPR-associated endonuclease/helicase Cas3
MAQDAQDFPSWYQHRHGYQPFPWQAALASRIAAEDWPDALTPPTGSGKTAVIDVWLWARLQGLPVPRRLVYVIDRRLVVDGVTEYATTLAASLEADRQPAVVTLRGGMAFDDGWLSDPLRPAVIISTVDQVGSRLLFSGYGISSKAASIHAGLLGNDALFVIDEVHLVRPLLQTLASVAGQRGNALPLPWRVLPMSATWTGDNTHGLSNADWLHPVLSRRLKAGKLTLLLKLPADADLSRTLADEALRLRRDGASVVAVVCNRVDRARAVFERLQEHGEAVLLTGRIRPCDKAALTTEYLPRMAVGSRGHRAPLFVVATQTIEVGADLDMDGLVTECAPLSALRQRFGRLNRLGELDGAPAVIVYKTPEKKSDPIYGEDIEHTWKWLDAVATGKPKSVDFGIRAMDQLIADQPPPREDEKEAPTLLPAHVDMLSRTSVNHGIDVAPWLHGWNSSSADVYLCWRADWAKASIEVAPPAQHELLAVPLHALRRWSAQIADIEGGEPIGRDSGREHKCIRWDGDEAQAIRTGEARAGDTLVLPTETGGCDRYGWAPRSKRHCHRCRRHNAASPTASVRSSGVGRRDSRSARRRGCRGCRLAGSGAPDRSTRRRNRGASWPIPAAASCCRRRSGPVRARSARWASGSISKRSAHAPPRWRRAADLTAIWSRPYDGPVPATTLGSRTAAGRPWSVGTARSCSRKAPAATADGSACRGAGATRWRRPSTRRTPWCATWWAATTGMADHCSRGAGHRPVATAGWLG